MNEELGERDVFIRSPTNYHMKMQVKGRRRGKVDSRGGASYSDGRTRTTKELTRMSMSGKTEVDFVTE